MNLLSNMQPNNDLPQEPSSKKVNKSLFKNQFQGEITSLLKIELEKEKSISKVKIEGLKSSKKTLKKPKVLMNLLQPVISA